MLCDAELRLKYDITGLVSTRSYPNLEVEVTRMLLNGMMAAHQHIDGGQMVTQFIGKKHALLTRMVDGKVSHATTSITSLSKSLQVVLCFYHDDVCN